MTYLTSAIILKKYDCGDYDRQFLLYTRESGKVTVIAKGAKKITSKLNPHLDYFSVCQLMLAQGATGIDRLAGVGEAVCNRAKICAGKQFYGYYFLEAVDKLTLAKAKDEAVFGLADNFLSELADSAVGRELLDEIRAHGGMITPYEMGRVRTRWKDLLAAEMA